MHSRTTSSGTGRVRSSRRRTALVVLSSSSGARSRSVVTGGDPKSRHLSVDAARSGSCPIEDRVHRLVGCERARVEPEAGPAEVGALLVGQIAPRVPDAL